MRAGSAEVASDHRAPRHAPAGATRGRSTTYAVFAAWNSAGVSLMRSFRREVKSASIAIGVVSDAPPQTGYPAYHNLLQQNGIR